MKKRTGIEREGEDDSYLAWNVGSEKSHFHLLSKFSILVCICGILFIYYYSVRLIEKEKTDVSILKRKRCRQVPIGNRK